jgi:hypothetical protein
MNCSHDRRRIGSSIDCSLGYGNQGHGSGIDCSIGTTNYQQGIEPPPELDKTIENESSTTKD